METNKKAQHQSFGHVVSPYQQWKGAEFGQLKYMDLSFLCNWKPLRASGEGGCFHLPVIVRMLGANCFFGVRIFAPSIMKTKQPKRSRYLLYFLQKASETV